MFSTSTTAATCPVVVAIPTTARVLPIPYALPPSIILTAVTPPVGSTVTLAVAFSPVTDAPIDTNLTL